MISIDLQNAFEPGHHADNFTVLLLRLIAKADSNNRKKLRREYPIEVKAVDIYKTDCPYKDEAKTVVDWQKLEWMAQPKIVEGSSI